MFYCDKTELAKAKKMNRKCREAGVIALDYDGRDSDMYAWSDTFYLYFPTKESLDVFAESDYFGFYAKHIGLYIIHNDHGAHLIPIDYHAARFEGFMKNKAREKTAQLTEIESFEEEGTAV